jgi:hypothetical protein
MKVDLGRTFPSDKLRFSSGKLRTSKSGRGIPPGSPLNMIIQDQHDFELQVGRAMDVLRHDYPCILTDKPGTLRHVTLRSILRILGRLL